MPFIRHTRDKRGYETTYVMHAYRPQPGPQRTRVLYLFRSPSHIKLGRHALDDEIREALEHTHPDVSFDWTLLGRESMAQQRADTPRDRPVRPRRPAPPTGAPPPKPVPVVLEDHSILGRVVGAVEAAKLRARYADLLQRVLRRSRTPEDRDRLIDRAHRLNPDDWQDEPAVRAAVGQVEAEWEAVVGELPLRRRGRRGGKRRFEGEAGDGSLPTSAGADAPSSVLSGIIEERESGGNDDAGFEGVAERGGDRVAGAATGPDGGGAISDPDIPGDG